jgi:hypothetical protein
MRVHSPPCGEKKNPKENRRYNNNNMDIYTHRKCLLRRVYISLCVLYIYNIYKININETVTKPGSDSRADRVDILYMCIIIYRCCCCCSTRRIYTYVLYVMYERRRGVYTKIVRYWFVHIFAADKVYKSRN